MHDGLIGLIFEITCEECLVILATCALVARYNHRYDLRYDQRDTLRRAKRLRKHSKHHGVFINPDRSPLQQLSWKSLTEERKLRRIYDKDVVIYREQVVLCQNIKKFESRLYRPQLK